MLADERGENLVEGVLRFGVGQRAIGGLKRQADRQADSAVGNALAGIAIEELNCGERRRAIPTGRLNGATNDLGRQDIRHDDRQVAHDRRIPRQRQHALVTGQVLTSESYEEMTTPFMLENGRETGYGMGLQLDTQVGHPCVWHGGGIHGFNSVLLSFPDSRLSVAVISNGELRADALGLELARALLATK